MLAKAVPPVEELEYDPERFTVLRDRAGLFLNPFDQRALRVALELRRPGERVRLLSMGPPAARGVLKEAIVHGVDEVLLVSDPALVGSDTLATARILAAALRALPHDLVLAGAWTTDSETGQVPPEVAAILGRPVITGARAIARDREGSGFEISVDTPSGWARFRARTPCVVSVGEKIAKPLKATAEALAAVPESRVALLDRGSLGVAASDVGLTGSPTWVESVEEDAPVRRPEVFADGPLADRVSRAVEAVRVRLARPTAPLPALGPPPAHRAEDLEVIVLVTDPLGRCAGGALGAVSEVRRSWPGYWPTVLWIGAPPTEADTYRLDLSGALGGYLAPAPRAPIGSADAAAVLGDLLDRRPRAAAVLFLADAYGREVAGLLAGRRGLGLIGDAVGLGRDARGFVFSKPSFGGRTVARIRSRTTPALATVRPGSFVPAAERGDGGGVSWQVLPPAPAASPLQFLESGREVDEGSGPEGHDVVVAVGLGIGGPEGIERLRPFAARWHAAIGGTRRVVDAGWLPRQLQIGLTGRSLAPRLGVLLGVGGSGNHLVGWQRAGTLLAVNRDPSAPVFRGVDVGIVGELDEVLPRLAEALARALDA